MKRILSAVLALSIMAATAVAAFAVSRFELSLGLGFSDDESGVDIAASNTLLMPDTEYRFPLMISVNGNGAVPFDDSHLGEKDKLTVSVTGGSTHITTPKIEEEGGQYYVVVTTRPKYGVRPAEVSFRIRYSALDIVKAVSNTALDVTARVGQAVMDTGDIAGFSEGDYLDINNDAPIITKRQFDQLAEINRYRAVTLTNSALGWQFAVNVSEMNTANLYSTAAAPLEIVKKYDEDNREFLFFSFPGAPNFGVTGQMTLDVAHAADGYDGAYYLYLYKNRVLYYLSSTYDEDAATISFRTSSLSSYVLTNMRMEEGYVDGTIGTTGTVGSGGASGTGTGATNPDTGGNDVTALAGALAALSLLCMGAVSLKKK